MELLKRAAARNLFRRDASKASSELGSIYSSFMQGIKFANLAKNRSLGPGASKGGDIGWIGRYSPYGPLLESVAFSLQPGDTSNPFQTTLGYAFLRVTDKKKGDTPDQDRVKVSLILIPFNDEIEEVQQAMHRVVMGTAPIVYRNEEVAKLLPEVYR